MPKGFRHVVVYPVLSEEELIAAMRNIASLEPQKVESCPVWVDGESQANYVMREVEELFANAGFPHKNYDARIQDAKRPAISAVIGQGEPLGPTAISALFDRISSNSKTFGELDRLIASRSHHETVVVSNCSGAQETAARLYAVLNKADFRQVESVEQMSLLMRESQGNDKKIRNFACFLDHTSLNTSEVQSLLNHSTDGLGSQEVGFGIFSSLNPRTTARNVALSYVLRSLLQASLKITLVNQLSQKIWTRPKEGQVRRQITEQLNHELVHLMGYTGHGLFCGLYMGRDEGTICPVNIVQNRVTGPLEQVAEAAQSYPECIYKGRSCREFAHNIPLARMGDSRMKMPLVVLANTCSSIRFDDLYYQEFNVAERFLEAGTLAYIGSVRSKFGTGLETIAATHLLSRGYNLGEVVRLLNNLRLYAGDGACYALLGDPLLTFSASTLDISMPTSRAANDKPKTTHSFDEVVEAWEIALPRSQILDLIKKGSYIQLESLEEGADVCVVPDISKERLLAFKTFSRKGEHKSPQNHELSFLPAQDLMRFIEPLRSTVTNAQAMRFFGIKGLGKLDGLSNDLAAHALSLSESLFNSYGVFLPTNTVRNLTANKIDSVNLYLATTIKAYLHNRTKEQLEEIYGTYFSMSEILSYDGKCGYCNGSVVLRRFRNPLVVGQTRLVFECLRCKTIGDTPEVSDVEGQDIRTVKAIPAIIKCDGRMRLGQSYRMQVELKSFDRCYKRGIIMIRGQGPINMAMPEFRPDAIAFSLDPFEERTFSFDIDFSSSLLVPSEYAVMAIIVQNCEVLLASRPVQIISGKLHTEAGLP